MLKENDKLFERGNILLADLGVVTTKTGSLQMGKRPVIVVSNDLNNKYSTMISIVPLTTSKFKKNLPTHVEINKQNSKIEKDSIALAEQVMVIPKTYIIKNEPLFKLSDELMLKTEVAIAIQFGLMNLARAI